MELQMVRRVSADVAEPLLSEWGRIARHNKSLHEAASAHFSGRSDFGLITAVVLGSAGGLINILIGAAGPELGGAAAVVNISQVALGCASVLSAAIISAAKQLGWESKAHKHGEYACHYGELARLINSERTLAILNDSSFASVGDLIKKVQADLDKIEEGAPPIPGFIEKKLGEKTNGSLSASRMLPARASTEYNAPTPGDAGQTARNVAFCLREVVVDGAPEVATNPWTAPQGTAQGTAPQGTASSTAQANAPSTAQATAPQGTASSTAPSTAQANAPSTAPSTAPVAHPCVSSAFLFSGPGGQA